MTREIYQTEQALAAALGRRIIDVIRRYPALVLGLPTGRSPLALYHELRRVTEREEVDWSHVRTFNLDEFVGLSRGDAGSYRTFMEERLFRHVGVRPEHIGFLDGRAADLDAECRRYERQIAGAGGIDLLILGIGANGHIGFNEPAPALAVRTHRATLDDATRAGNALWFDGDVQRVPRQALTMGMGTILGARSIIMVATGEAKVAAVRALFEGGVSTAVPASFLHLHPRVTAMLDEPLADALVTPQ